ncbi:MAG: peptidoglycan DD-metalloendopeptidase family protein [Rickettsiales bacterium]|jgi:murein DD-endopeptidase MepM/ murein hydrolase activator NlpD|nr:peptidoglycan DD-metalloendopeptidase family protein [Rickettsiales bacterium]
MKKSKTIIGANRIAQIAILLALLLATVAAAMLLIKPARQMSGVSECTSHVMVSAGDTLSKLLIGQGLSAGDVDTIAKALKSQAGISSLRADSDKIIFSRPADDAPISKIVLIPSPWRQVELTCGDGSWLVRTIDIERDTRLIYKKGEIKDGDSFYVAGTRAGIPAGILADVYDLLAFEMDFERDVRAGQSFFVLYEENYSQGEKIDSGRVIAVSFQALRGQVNMYRFRKSDGAIGYYDEDGNGAIKSLKRTPINNARVSSSFNLKRRHPVLGYTRAHKGVDFRAAHGTSIPSAGAGRIVARGYNKGHGNFIRVRHNGAYETLYAHMSKFAKGVNVGTSVRQGQTIGYVGSTGLSTGPHLHYEIIKNGHHVNPMTVKLPAISNLDSENKKKFLKIRELVDNTINTLAENPRLFVQM